MKEFWYLTVQVLIFQSFLDVAVCLWQRDRACPVADSDGMTTTAGHCAGRSARSAGRVVTKRVEFGSDERHRVESLAWKLCASLYGAANPAPSCVRRRDWRATQDRRSPVLSESPWRRSTAGHHSRRLIVSAAWGSAVAMPPSTWRRRYAATTSGHSRRGRQQLESRNAFHGRAA